MKTRILFLLCVVSLVPLSLVFAQANISSNGTGGGDWNTTGAWNGGVIPGTSDTAIIVGSDSVFYTVVPTASPAKLTMQAGARLCIGQATTGLSLTGVSWDLATTSTVYYYGTTSIQSAPTYGNLAFFSANGGPNGNLTVKGNLLNLGTGSIRGIAATSGSYTHTVSGDVLLTNASSKITAVNNSASTTASCTWNIGGSIKLTGANTNNRIILYESAGPHLGSAVFNVDGNIEIAASSQIMYKSSSATSNNYSAATINLKGNLVQNGSIGINSITSGTVDGLIINFIGTSQQTWSGTGAFSVSLLSSVTMNINNATGVVLGANRTFNASTRLALTNGALSLSTYTLSFSGLNTRLIYQGSSPQTTTDAEFPATPPKYVVINNPSGVTLHAARTINDTLVLTNGNLSTTTTNLLTLGSASVIQSASASSFIDGPVSLTWSANGVKTYPIGNGSVYRPVDVNLTSTNAVLRMQLINSNAGGDKGGLDAISIMRYYQTALTNTGSGTVKLSYGADDGVQNSANLVVAQSTTASGAYTSLGMSANDASSVTSSSYDPSLGDFLLLGSTGGNTLPVELTSFVAAAGKYNAQLSWKVASEKNAFGYDILRREVGKNESMKVGFVKAAGAGDYSYNDANVKPGNYIYDLKQVDNDGTYKIYSSSQIAVGTASKELTLGSYPNPFNPTTNIEFTLPENGYATLKIFNVIGQEVATLFNGQVEAGMYNKVTFSAGKLSSGMYFSVLESGSQRIVKKMLLTK
jgi:hypothetical protein